MDKSDSIACQSMPAFYWCCHPIEEGDAIGEANFYNKLGMVTLGEKTFRSEDEIDYTFSEIYHATRSHAYEQTLEFHFNGETRQRTLDRRNRVGWWWFGPETDSFLQIKNTATGEIWHFAWMVEEEGKRRWNRLTPIEGSSQAVSFWDGAKRLRVLVFEICFCVVFWGAIGFVVLSFIASLLVAA